MTFSSEIITLIDELAARFGIVIDWTAENIIPYLTDLGTRFIALVTWQSIFGICLTSSLLLLSIFLFRKGNKIRIANGDEHVYAPIMTVGVFAIIFSTIINLITIPSFINQILECKFLPEKIILDYLKDILAH